MGFGGEKSVGVGAFLLSFSSSDAKYGGVTVLAQEGGGWGGTYTFNKCKKALFVPPFSLYFSFSREKIFQEKKRELYNNQQLYPQATREVCSVVVVVV